MQWVIIEDLFCVLIFFCEEVGIELSTTNFRIFMKYLRHIYEKNLDFSLMENWNWSWMGDNQGGYMKGSGFHESGAK